MQVPSWRWFERTKATNANFYLPKCPAVICVRSYPNLQLIPCLACRNTQSTYAPSPALARAPMNGLAAAKRLRRIDLAQSVGQARSFVSTAYLDQNLGILAADRLILDQLQSLNRQLNEGQLRTRLAQLGLNTNRINLLCHRISGVERLKTAMASLLYVQTPPHLLLLDEPANHLDLPSILALQSMLNQYSGTLVITSHDEVFLAAIGITHRLKASPTGWLQTPV